MTYEEVAHAIERDYYAELAAIRGNDRALDDFPTLREYLHKRGFSYKWLTQHGYTDETN